MSIELDPYKPRPPVPSVPYLIRSLFEFIANHPLFINPPVYHPETNEQIKPRRYRLYSGIQIPVDGLSIAIFPYSRDGVASPGSNSVTVMYDPHNLGSQGHEKASYFIVIGFYYNDVVIGNLSQDKNIITVPASSQIELGKMLLTSNFTKEVELEVNPGMDIIGQYAALTRYVINDVVHQQCFPLAINSMEVLYENIRSQNWEESKNIYFQEGFVMVRLDAHVSRGWRDKFTSHLTIDDFNLFIN